MFLDWGRAVNITYVSSVLFLFYLIKNEYIKINNKEINKKLNYMFENFNKLIFFASKKQIILFVFIIYSFGWSPPTLLSADVNSFPGYRIPYKTAKMIIYNYKTN